MAAPSPAMVAAPRSGPSDRTQLVALSQWQPLGKVMRNNDEPNQLYVYIYIYTVYV